MLAWLSRLNLFCRGGTPASVIAERTPSPPMHIRVHSVGGDARDCLHELEREAGLPPLDLSFDYEKGMDWVSFPTGMRSICYPIVSKTGEQMKRKAAVGYISGSLYEPKLQPHFFDTDERLISGKYHGTLHISKNCPGVYRDNICTTCGDRVH